MITSINEFKQYINETIDVKDSAFDKFIRTNADKLVNRTSKYLPQINKLFAGSGFMVIIDDNNSKYKYKIINAAGETVLSSRMFRDLMEKIRDLARPYATLKQSHTKETPTVLNNNGTTKVSVTKTPVLNTEIMSLEDLSNNLENKSYKSGRFDIDFDIQKTGDNIRLLIAAHGKRGYPREAYLKALSTPLPTLPNGYEYVDRKPKDYTGNIMTPTSIKSDDDNYDDRGYIDSEFSGVVYYNVQKTS